MAPGRRIIESSLRHAIVRRVFKTYVECEYTDALGDRRINCPLPHPVAGLGTGIFVGIEKDTRVIIATAQMESPFIVAIVPNRRLYHDQEGVPGAPINRPKYPSPTAGEIVLQGPDRSTINFFKDGTICINAGSGDGLPDIELSASSQTLFTRVNNEYTFTEAGRHISGVVKRDVGKEENPSDTVTFNFLTGDAVESLLKQVGRSPEDEVQYRTTTITSPRKRNPALVENRSIIYEYANGFNVKTIQDEIKAHESADKNNLGQDIEFLQEDPSVRSRRRTDILNLNLKNYNHLIEKVEGTVVDIYGNILDINRNIISIPGLYDPQDTSNNSNNSNDKGLNDTFKLLRRSIKSHYEINSRKNLPAGASNSDTDKGAKNHSRFSIDIDGEGLTKVNIPSSSNTGNIPVLTRYVTSRGDNADENEEDPGQFRDSDRKDIRVIPFSSGGPSIKNLNYIPEPITGSVTVGTAHHDILNVASSITSGGVVTDSVDNSISGSGANAGGRSFHANLDGSAEISIGEDNIDNKSLVLDLAGGMISHFGKDKNGRSIVHQSDGDVLIQIGGAGNPGKLEIHVKGFGEKPSRLIIDQTGFTLDIQGNGLIKTLGDLGITAGGNLLLNGVLVWNYGSMDEENRVVTGKERLVVRNGNVMIM